MAAVSGTPRVRIDLTGEAPSVGRYTSEPMTLAPEPEEKGGICFETLCYGIQFHLETGFTPHRAAIQILTTSDPQAIFSLTGYRRQALMGKIGPFLGSDQNLASRIRRAVLILYTSCLRNSNYHETVTHLESKIREFLRISTQDHVEGVLSEARSQLLLPLPHDERDLRDAQANIRARIPQISDILNLFAYSEPDAREKIEILAEYTFDRGGKVFPVCSAHFRSLCQQIEHITSKKGELASARNQLMQKCESIQKHLIEIEQSKLPEVPRIRKQVLDYHATTLWNASATFLKIVFQVTFARKKRERYLRLSQHFVNAVNTRKHRFDGMERNQKIFNFLLRRRTLPEIPDQYLCTVLGRFMGGNGINDFSDFMGLWVRQMGDDTFQNLQRALQSSQRETGVVTVLKRSFCQNSTFDDIKKWVQQVSRPRPG